MYLDIIILSKSIKHGGYCVAGLDKSCNRLIRLVSIDENSYGALSRDDIVTYDGIELKILDLVKVKTERNVPTSIQPENVLIDRSERIHVIRTITLTEILDICEKLEKHEMIFLDTDYRIQSCNINNVGYSLDLVIVDNLHLYRGGCDGNYKTKCDFVFNNREYNYISVTDSNLFYYGRCGKETNIKKALILCSLPDDKWSMENSYFKYLACLVAIIE